MPVRQSPRIVALAHYLSFGSAADPDEAVVRTAPGRLRRLALAGHGGRRHPPRRRLLHRLPAASAPAGGERAGRAFRRDGARIAGGLRWIHVACTKFLCHFRLGESRGDAVADAAGIVVHDHFGPQFGIEGVDHAGCNAHNLRDLQGLVENGDEVRAENLGFHLVSAIAAAGEAQGAAEAAQGPQPRHPAARLPGRDEAEDLRLLPDGGGCRGLPDPAERDRNRAEAAAEPALDAVGSPEQPVRETEPHGPIPDT